MKIFKKILLVLLALLVVFLAVIFAFRVYNDHKYSSWEVNTSTGMMAYYQNPKDLSLYPTNILWISVEHISGKYLNGFALSPDEKKYEGVVVVFGGSDGSPGFERGVQIAKEGYEVLSLFFFGMPNQKPTLAEVPLEYYEEIESYIFSHYGEGTKITLVGASKGAEFVLLLATHYPSIANVIAYAPWAYVFSGLDFEKNTSSWSLAGSPVPYVDITQWDGAIFVTDVMWQWMTKWPISYARSYADAVTKDSNIEEKRIPIEKTKANIVLFAGDDDQMWKSAEMAQELKNMRPENTELVIYKGAGHIFGGNGIVTLGGMRMAVGGNTEANTEAFHQNNADLIRVLDAWHRDE